MRQHYKLLLPGMILALAVMASPFASAQSSGNFASQISTTQCVINTMGGTPNAGGRAMETCLSTFIATSSGVDAHRYRASFPPLYAGSTAR